MKRRIWVFSLAMLLFSTFTPSFTYATGEVENEAKEILSNTLEDTMTLFDNSHWVASLQQSQNDDRSICAVPESNNLSDEIEIVRWNNHILWNKTKWLITIYSNNYSSWVTIKDKNIWSTKYLWEEWATNEEIYWNFYKWWFSAPVTIDNYTSEISNITDGNERNLCEESFSIPETSDRSNLKNLYNPNSENIEDFFNDFKLSKWWMMVPNNNWWLIASTIDWFYRTKTNYDLNKAYMAVVYYYYDNNNTTIDFITWTAQNKWMWMPIRCFKKQFEPYLLPVKFNPNWWAFSWMNKNEVKIYEYQTDVNWIKPINNIQIPNRIAKTNENCSWWMFDWWYTKSWENNDWWEEFDISNPQSTVAYAKWLPFNDMKVTLSWTTIVLMDRNLWATTNNKNSTDSYGYYYQWWNNYWFKNDGYPSNSWYDLIINNDQDNNPWWPWNYFYSNKFIKRSSNPYRRDYDNNMNLWWWENQKNIDLDRTGPCPTWYHIPDYNEWYGIRDLINKELTINPNYCSWELDTLAKCFLSKLNLPFVGRINYWNAAVDSSSSTDYRSSTRWDNSDYWLSHGAMAIDIYWNGVYGYHTYRAFALPIRCFKNTTPINNLTIVKDNWEDDIVYHLRWWEAINSDYKQDDPINKWYRFLWWYSWDNKFSFDWSRYYDSVIVKAKREKRPWYTYDANWWVFENWTEENIIKFDETEFERKVSHTPNVNDDWTTNWSYPGNYNSIDVLTIEWANILELNVKWLTKCKNWICDYVAVWKWNHPNYDASNYLQYDEDFLWVLSNWQYKSYRFWEEDSFTLWFYSSGNKIDWYVLWYFAELIWLKYTTEESIATPERKWYTFSWWYESWALEPFDFTWTKINQDRTFYAKWNPHHYTIKFNKNEWSWLVEDINATYWEEIGLPNVTREWYSFKWWQSEDWVIYKNVVPELTWVTSEDWVIVTLTAQWDMMQPSAWGWSTINPSKQETKITEKEHNSADTEKVTEKTTEQDNTKTTSTQTTSTPTINEQVKKVEWKSLTRWEIAVMTNILLEVYPQLTENKSLNKVSEACENFADEQNFTKDEKKAITRLCKLSIMWIHRDNNEPLDEFMVRQYTTNWEFATVMDRVVANYNSKDLSIVKDALKKLEWDEENVVFGTVYDVFMSIKNIFN